MNVLITAGGTCEDIDSVRSISNQATGRLGSIIADVFAREGAKVTYVCGESSALPSCECTGMWRVKGVVQLMERLEAILRTKRFDCVIHSMAVSDFTPQAIATPDEMAEAVSEMLQGESVPYAELSDKIRTAIFQCARPLTGKKISSKSENAVLFLKQTPKVIRCIKAIQPQTVLVGFKLLSNVPEEELLEAGFGLMKKNACDFVLANDLANIAMDKHQAVLLSGDTVLWRAHTKQEIAQMIFESVSERVKNQ